MGTPRQRQVKKGQDPRRSEGGTSRPGPMSSRRSRQSRQSRRRLYLSALAGLGLLILVYIGLARDAQPLQYGNKAIDQLALSLNLHKQFHVVIIDAGSTASRVIAFTFHKSVVNGKLVLDDELFVETKPGLSAYAKAPKDVRQPLELLLSRAKERIPETEWLRTPLVMRATAGLRLLPGHEAQDILAESRRVLLDSGFLLANDAVEIMRGSDEGLFSWFSVNFLEERFSSSAEADTVAALDLGGGSTQMTFALTPSELEPLAAGGSGHVDSEDLKYVNVFGRNLTIFTRSFLGLGLMAARKEILSHQDNKYDVKSGEQGKDIELRAECINPIISKAPWRYGNENYLISGPQNGSHKIIKTQNFAGVDEDVPIVRFTTCLDIIKKVVNASIPAGLPKPVDHEIYAFSYYFEKATEVGLIDPFTGGAITLESFYKAADKACQDPNTDQPFICLDLTFIYVLLHDGFGIEDTTKIFLRKKIKGHELSWALGAAFNVLDPDS